MFPITDRETEHTDPASAGNGKSVEMNDSKIQLDLSLGASTPRWVLLVPSLATSFSWRQDDHPILGNEIWLRVDQHNAK